MVCLCFVCLCVWCYPLLMDTLQKKKIFSSLAPLFSPLFHSLARNALDSRSYIMCDCVCAVGCVTTDTFSGFFFSESFFLSFLGTYSLTLSLFFVSHASCSPDLDLIRSRAVLRVSSLLSFFFLFSFLLLSWQKENKPIFL